MLGAIVPRYVQDFIRSTEGQAEILKQAAKQLQELMTTKDYTTIVGEHLLNNRYLMIPIAHHVRSTVRDAIEARKTSGKGKVRSNRKAL